MSESDTHRQMKRVAKEMLEMSGHTVQLEKEMGDVILDVYGEKAGETVAVEVGNLDHQRADYIQSNVDTLTHIPYKNLGEYDNATSSPTGDNRVNVYMNTEIWEKLGEVAGSNSRSETVRKLIKLYLAAHGEEEF